MGHQVNTNTNTATGSRIGATGSRIADQGPVGLGSDTRATVQASVGKDQGPGSATRRASGFRPGD